MTEPETPRDLHGVIADMEDDIQELEGFAAAVRHMGQCNEDPPRHGVFVVGATIEAIAASLREQWDRAFDLSKRNEGGAP